MAESKTGRPSDYTPELATAICDRLATGESLRAICASDKMPDKATVFRWLYRHDAFRDQYARAREAQADFLADETIEIADASQGDFIEKDIGDGVTIEVVDHEHIARSRLRVDTRKWFAGKVAPKKYGDRVALTGGDGGALKVDNVHSLSDAELAAIAATGRSRAAAKAPGQGKPDRLHKRRRGARKARQ